MLLLEPFSNCSVVKVKIMLTILHTYILQLLLAIPTVRCLSTDVYLQNHWPISNATLYDVIGNAHMTQNGTAAYFATDRCGTPNSSLVFNDHVTQLPEGVYFKSSSFTISAWVFSKHIQYARLVDIGMPDSLAHTIRVYVSDLTREVPTFKISEVGSKWAFFTKTNSTLELNKWSFLVASFNGTCAKVYINGTEIAQDCDDNVFTPKNINRTSNYISMGEINNAPNSHFHPYMDDLKFYNIC